jgi:ribose 5-phosphate isomerase A
LLGLGSGSTAAFAVEALGRRVHAGLRIEGVPTSNATAELARKVGIPLVELSEGRRIDLTIDGADEVESGTLNLIKGLGGALVREKIVASASERLVIVVDETKMVQHLGQGLLPVEVIPFGWQVTLHRLRQLGATSALRRDARQEPFVSDGGHYILDCRFDAGFSPAALAEALDRMVGVVDHGLFLNMTSRVVMAGAEGVKVLGG